MLLEFYCDILCHGCQEMLCEIISLSTYRLLKNLLFENGLKYLGKCAYTCYDMKSLYRKICNRVLPITKVNLYTSYKILNLHVRLAIDDNSSNTIA